MDEAGRTIRNDFYKAEVSNVTPLLWKDSVLDTKTFLKNSHNCDSVHCSLLSNANFEIQGKGKKERRKKKLIRDFKMIVTEPIYLFTLVLLKILLVVK